MGGGHQRELLLVVGGSILAAVALSYVLFLLIRRFTRATRAKQHFPGVEISRLFSSLPEPEKGTSRRTVGDDDVPRVECKGCGEILRARQVRDMRGRPEYSEWCREGYCSLDCFQQRGTPAPEKVEHRAITTAGAPSESDMQGSDGKPYPIPQHRLDWRTTAVVSVVACAMLSWIMFSLWSRPGPKGFRTSIPAAVAARPPEFDVGDSVVTVDRCVLKDGARAVAELPKGTKLRVVKLNGDWIGCSALVDWKEVGGWINKRLVAKDKALTVPATQSITAGPRQVPPTVSVASTVPAQPAAVIEARLGTYAFKETRLGQIDGQRQYPTYSHGRHFAYATTGDRKQCVVLDGQAGEQYDSICKESLMFSPDGNHFAYTARTAGKECVVLDGHAGPGYDGIGRKKYCDTPAILFSPDSTRLAYSARNGNTAFVVVGGERHQQYDGVAADSLAFSPDGRHLAYVAAKDRRMLLVVDGRVVAQHAGINIEYEDKSIHFSPDSQHLAYVAAERDHHWFVVLDGREA